MKLLAFGDLHLGAGGELGRAPGDRLHDQAEVLGRIGGLAVERAVDGILIAGDVFEDPGIPPEQLQLFAQFVAACHVAEIPILAITGNGKHDAAVRATNGLAIFQHIPGIEISSTPGVHEFAGCAIATLPWVHPGRYVAAHGGDASRDEVNSVVADLLLEAARGLRAQINGDSGPAILLAHWSVSGSALPNGIPVDQLREPVLPLDELEQLGFDAIVLGHIHAPQNFATSITLPVFYVGSPLPLNFGEANTEHGVWILEFDDGGIFTGLEHVPVDSPPLITLERDLTVSDDELEWIDGLDFSPHPRDLDGAIVRVKFRATTEQMRKLDIAAARAMLLRDGAHSVKIVPDILRADRARVEGVDESLSTLAALELYVAANAIEHELADQMRAKTTEYLEAVA